MFESFFGNEAQQYAYYSVPQLLFTDYKFKALSCESKLLYAFLLDRAGLSSKNGWLDNDGKVYVYFKLDELCEKLNIGKDKAIKVFNELDEKKGIGLICRKKQGQGKPTKIYVNNFTKFNEDSSDFGSNEPQTSENQKSGKSKNNSEVKTSEKPKSKNLKSRSLEYGNSEVLIDNHPNRINLSESSLSINQNNAPETDLRTDLLKDKIDMIDFKTEKEKVFEQIEGEYILSVKNKAEMTCYDREELEELVELIAWTNLTPIKVVKINGVNIDTNIVKNQFSKLDEGHILYVLECLKENTTKIKNRRNYLLTCIYNAPTSIDGYYRNLVNHDLYGG